MRKKIYKTKAYRYIITIIHEQKILTECHIYSSYIYREGQKQTENSKRTNQKKNKEKKN